MSDGARCLCSAVVWLLWCAASAIGCASQSGSTPAPRAGAGEGSGAAGAEPPAPAPRGSSPGTPDTAMTEEECQKAGGRVTFDPVHRDLEMTSCPDGTALLGDVTVGVERALCCATAQQPTAVP